MSCIGKECISNIVPRVLSLLRSSSAVYVFGRYLVVNCTLQDIYYLEENGFLFNWHKKFAFEDFKDNYEIMINLNYWIDMFLRFQSSSYKSFLPSNYRETLKNELRKTSCGA